LKNEKLLFRAHEVESDPSQFPSLDAFLAAPVVTRRQSYKQVEFVRGPIPIPWLIAACAISQAAALLGVILWHLARLRGEPFKVSSKQVGRYGYHRNRAARLLRALAKAQLITLEVSRGRAPLVRIVRGGFTPVNEATNCRADVYSSAAGDRGV
jgi:hypothetical protein